MDRINVYPTTTTLVSISPPDLAHCGETITFTVTVVNNRGVGFPVPTGTVFIKDNFTGDTLANGSLSSGTAIIATPLSNGNLSVYAEYDGIVNMFGASQSSPNISYNVNVVDTTTTITNISGTYFCFNSSFNLTAHIHANEGIINPIGLIQFNLYSDPISFITIGTTFTNISGNATLSMPAGITVPGNDYYIQAIFLGSGCFGPSSTLPGTHGTLVHSIDLNQNATTTVAGVSGGTTFCINTAQTFTATISSTHLGGPSVGSVIWIAEKLPSVIPLGTDSAVTAGSASIIVPGGTFTSTGSWTVLASYTGDGYCFANSFSAPITVHPGTFNVDISYQSGSTLFCYAIPQIFTYNVSSSGAGTISGFFLLRSSLGYDLSSTSASGTAAGFIVTFNILGFTAVDGAQNFFVQFTPDIGSCYNTATSPNTSVNIKSFLSQTPSAVNLMYSPPSGGTIFTVFNFTITVLKGSGIGPVDGAGSLNGSGTLFRHDIDGNFYVINNNVHIYDYGSYGSGSYSTSGLPTSTIGIVGRWNGNSCYATADSSELPITITPIIH